MIVNILKKNWILILILLIGAFLRFYKIDLFMTFLGDEGRDAIIVRNLLVNADPILIGPGTSVGGMYLGPLYYYFMAPFLLLSNFSPVGPAMGVALLGVTTIYLIYIAGCDWFNKKVGLVASVLFAISPTVITYSHSSWNPNIMPFFALLSIYSIWKVYSQQKYIWLLITAVSFAFVLQSHYLGVFIAPVLIIYWYLSRVPKKYSLISILLFLFLMSPLLIFDIRHNFLNSKALYKFLTVREEILSVNPWSSISKTYPLFEQINSSMLTAKQEPAGKIITIIIILSITIFLFKKKRFTVHCNQPALLSPFILLLLWLAIGVIGLGLYELSSGDQKQNIYDHYFGFLFPVPFLLIGVIFQKMYESKYKLITVLIFGVLVFLNLSHSPIRENPNNQTRRAENVSEKIINESKNEKFNIAVVADSNYEDGYQYFLEKENAKIIEIDAQIPETVTNQLFVICEKPREECDPTHSPKAEVANFGWSTISGQWTVDGVQIYKLIHSK